MNDVFSKNKTVRNVRREQIQVKLELPPAVISYFKNLEQQESKDENTGFSCDITGKMDLHLPLRREENLKVLDSHLLLEGCTCCFIAEIQII